MPRRVWWGHTCATVGQLSGEAIEVLRAPWPDFGAEVRGSASAACRGARDAPTNSGRTTKSRPTGPQQLRVPVGVAPRLGKGLGWPRAPRMTPPVGSRRPSLSFPNWLGHSERRLGMLCWGLESISAVCGECLEAFGPAKPKRCQASALQSGRAARFPLVTWGSSRNLHARSPVGRGNE